MVIRGETVLYNSYSQAQKFSTIRKQIEYFHPYVVSFSTKFPPRCIIPVGPRNGLEDDSVAYKM